MKQAVHTVYWNSNPSIVNLSISWSRVPRTRTALWIQFQLGWSSNMPVELVPFITVYCNTSLRDGSFPDSQKNAIVTPILKKANLDAHAAANYRPISNLSYLSKLLERCVNKQLNDYLSTNNLLPSVQSAYRKFHSTESAVLKVLSDIYAALLMRKWCRYSGYLTWVRHSTQSTIKSSSTGCASSMDWTVPF